MEKERKKVMKRIIAIILCMVLVCGLLTVSGCSDTSTAQNMEDVETYIFTDSCGREVEIPKNITRVAASGSTAQMVLATIAPDLLVGLSSSFSTAQLKYFDESLWYLPTFGQFYGSKANLNIESLAAEEPQIIIDIGDKKDTHKQDMKTIQRQTGVPTIFIEATLDTFPEAYRTLGKVLGREEAGEEMAAYIEKTIEMADTNSQLIADEDRKTVFYGTTSTGLSCNASGSIQSDVIDAIGAVNAIQVPEDEITNSGGGTLINLEELYNADPDVIILTVGGPYDSLAEGGWKDLNAVKNGDYYEIPNEPYCWMSGPPSINRILGIWWLGQLVYPEIYNDYDMVEVAQEFFSLFYHYELSVEEAEELLTNSYIKP